MGNWNEKDKNTLPIGQKHIAYWPLPIGHCLPLCLLVIAYHFALSHYCHVENQKSFFKIESKIIKDDKHKLLFSSEKGLTSKVFIYIYIYIDR